MDFLDFLPRKSSITKLVIVGPYPSYDYISKLIGKNGITKNNLYIVADDGWDTDTFRKENFNVARVCAKTLSAIVHAKMYFIEFVNQKWGNDSILITGSANASVNGMKRNAESLSCYHFDSTINKEKIKCYFYDLSIGKSVKELSVGWKNKLTRLTLPPINKATPCSFESWIKTGYLFFQYDRDTSFGTISIKLSKSLPNELSFAGTGFANANKKERKIIRYRYLDNVKMEGKTRNNLKTYGIETNWGYWIPKECFEEKEHEIFPKKLKKSLRTYVEEKESNIDSVVDKILSDIEKIKRDNLNRDLDECFKNLNKRNLKILLKDKIKLDKSKAEEDFFKFRYITGFAKNKIPRLDGSDWDEFVLSIFDFCRLKGTSDCKNLFTKRIKDLVREVGKYTGKNIPFAKLDTEKLHFWVTNYWNTIDSCPIRTYYNNEPHKKLIKIGSNIEV